MACDHDSWLVRAAITFIIFTSAIKNITSSRKSNILSTLHPNIDPCSQTKWFCFNTSTRSYDCQNIYRDLIICTSRGPALQAGFCATYNEYTGLLSVTDCPYFQIKLYNITPSGYIELPGTLTELEDSMCGPLNRRGIVCSECMSSYGPSVNSFGYRCVYCTGVWYGIPLFLALKLVPITILYLIILIFQVQLTSPPMTSFTMYAQFIVTAVDLGRYDSSFKKLAFNDNGEFRLDVKIVHTLYGVFNLDFLRYAIPAFCVSDKLKPIHIAFLGYISVFYPLLLIFLTWLCIELHGRNIEPFVLLWKPFHKCFVCLRRKWDKKSDIIDVFTTFLYLLYGKCLYQTLVLLNWTAIVNFNSSGVAFLLYRPYLDPNIDYGKKHHLFFVIAAVIIFVIFNVLPLLVLTVYPVKRLRLSLLSKCNMNVATISMLTDKLYSCYRNGLDGTHNTRIFATLHCFLRLVVITVWTITQRFLKPNHWFCIGIVFTTSSLLIALIKPYNKPYMNYVDCLILFNLATICYILSQTILAHQLLLLARIAITAPIVIFPLILSLKKCVYCNTLCKKLRTIFTVLTYNTLGDPKENQPLLHPTCTLRS